MQNLLPIVWSHITASTSVSNPLWSLAMNFYAYKKYLLSLDLNTNRPQHLNSEHFGLKSHQSRGKDQSLSFNSLEGFDTRFSSYNAVIVHRFSKQLLSGQNFPRKQDFWSNFCLCLKKLNSKLLTLSQEYWLFCACVPGHTEYILPAKREQTWELISARVEVDPWVRRKVFTCMWSISVFYIWSIRRVYIFHSSEIIVYMYLSSSVMKLFIFVM